MWKPGDHLRHRHNSDLGLGRVRAVEGRQVVVDFPEAGEALRFLVSSEALVALELEIGGRARLASTGEVVTLGALDGSRCRLADGRTVELAELWPLPVERSPVDRLAEGKIGAFEDFVNRLDALRLREIREADGLGSFLGGRIRLFPHQLYAAERATRRDPVRWLLADEVGLGKTVEACLIMNRLIHSGRAERVLVVAPDTLTVQWLGELWRKYHQVFVLLDDRRFADLAKEHGPGFNPFDVHRRSIVSLERLREDRRLVEHAVAAGIDLLVVDEAHHLRRMPGHPGNRSYRAIAPIAAGGRHVLLLSATPLEDDAHGFLRLVQLLRPDELPEEESFDERLAARRRLPPCTSSARRSEIGGLPPRVGVAVDLDPQAWAPMLELERRVRASPAASAPAVRRKVRRLACALASAPALAELVGRPEGGMRELLERAAAEDPRLTWLADQAPGWAQRGEKTLIFVAQRPSLDLVKTQLERRGRIGVGIFHEDLAAERRDLEVARFRLPEGPVVLVSTEAGGEGRNFEFCHRLVLFDLPWNPAAVEQRIGRLDRIGREHPTEIVYFRPPEGFGRLVTTLYEHLGLFREPLGGLFQELRLVAREIERVAVEEGSGEPARENVEITPGEISDLLARILAKTQAARDRAQKVAYRELHRAPYRPALADGILARVPPELDRLNQDVVLRAAGRFGFTVEEHPARGAWLIELGGESLVDRLPGVEPGARFFGTFERERAVADEDLDYFAAGHPLVEGVLAELDDGPRGRVAVAQVCGQEEGFVLMAIYKRGVAWEAVAVDGNGREHPGLVRRLFDPDHPERLILEPVEPRRWTSRPGWQQAIQRLAARLPEVETPQAVMALRVRSSKRSRPRS